MFIIDIYNNLVSVIGFKLKQDYLIHIACVLFRFRNANLSQMLAKSIPASEASLRKILSLLFASTPGASNSIMAPGGQ